MLLTIDFHDEPVCEAYEVRDVGPDRNLPAKAVAAQTIAAQLAPQSRFRVC